MTTFNGLQRPDNIAVGQNISYTVPKGKIAKVKANLCATAYGRGTVGVQTGLTSNGMGVSESLEMVLVEGDILSSTRVTASATNTVSGSSSGDLTASSTSSVTMTVNSSNSLVVVANGHVSMAYSGTAIHTVNVTGSSNFGFFAEEYFG